MKQEITALVGAIFGVNYGGILSTFLLIGTLACQPQDQQSTQDRSAQEEKTNCVKDDLGQEFCFEDGGPPKAVSLSANITELLFIFYPDSCIVGCTPNCNYPQEEVKKLPRFQTYPLNTEQLLAQDLLYFVKSDLFPQKTLDRLNELGVRIFDMKFEKGEQAIYRQVRKLGKIAGKEKAAARYIDSVKSKINFIEEKAEAEEQKSVLYIIQAKPLIVMGRGGFFNQNLRSIGAENAVPRKIEQPYPQLSMEFLQQTRADVILGMSHQDFTENYEANLNLAAIPAYRNKAIYAVNADLQTRPGARIDQAIEELFEKVHSLNHSN